MMKKPISFLVLLTMCLSCRFYKKYTFVSSTIKSKDSCGIIQFRNVKGIIVRPDYVDLGGFFFDIKLVSTYTIQDYFPTREQVYKLEKRLADYSDSGIIKYNLNDSDYFRQYFGVKDSSGVLYIVCNINRVQHSYLIDCKTMYGKQLVWSINKLRRSFLYYYRVDNDSIYFKKNFRLISVSELVRQN
jgi:hypothetical protein